MPQSIALFWTHIIYEYIPIRKSITRGFHFRMS